jgi:transcriptional regulator with XRE-family HTH domain
MQIRVSDVVFRDDLYPRIETSAVTVQKYAEDLDVLPPIKVNQHHELIDGWHRWTAHKKNEVEFIEAEVIETVSDADLLEKAIETNASHGLQLSQSDKEKMAGRLYSAMLSQKPSKDELAAYKEKLASILSVTIQSVRKWTSRDDKDYKRELESKAFSMWLACHTQEEIADATGWSRPTVTSFVENENAFLSDKTVAAKANHADEAFQIPIYNIWKQQAKSEGSSHFGNSEVRWVDNLLYLYTKPFDVVVDPFAGGGSTIDICKKRLRRYFVSDRKPIVEREKEIRKHDLKDGPLKPPQWKDVKLVYLDPPYWIQAEGQYSQDAEDLGNQSLEDFTANLSAIINQYAKKLSDAYIALIIQPTQWKAPERQFVDHIGDMLRAVKLPVDMRYSVPYESQQCNAQMVEWSKENKRCLVLTREIVVWRVA